MADPAQGIPAPPSSAGPVVPQAPQQMVPLDWSHFKPEFSGKPDEDAEAHLLHKKVKS